MSGHRHSINITFIRVDIVSKVPKHNYRRLDSTSTKADNPTVSPALIPSLSGPRVSVCKFPYNIVIWRAENRTHLSKKTRPSTERSRKASKVRGIPSRPDDQLRWVLIVRTRVYDMGGELPYSQTSRLNHTNDYLIALT